MDSRKRFLRQCLLVLVLLTSSTVGFSRGGSTYGLDRPVRLDEFVGRRFEGDSRLRVKATLRMRDYTGYTLQSVSMVARTDAGRGRATLMINGREASGSQQVGRHHTRYTFRPNREFARMKLNEGINTIQLKLRGRFDVERLMATLVRQRADGRNEIIKKNLWSNYHGTSVIPVRKTLGLNQQFRNRRLLRVVLVGDSARGRATAQLEINGMPVGFSQRIGINNTRLVFKIPRDQNVIGRDIRTLKLRLRGNIHVEKLKAVLTRDSGSNPFPGGRTIDVPVNRFISSYDNDVRIMSLIGFPRLDNRPVRTVTVYARSFDYFSTMRVCGNRGVCRNSNRVESYTTPIRFHFRGEMLSELLLQVSRDVEISRIVVEF